MTCKALRLVDGFGLDRLKFEDVEVAEPGAGEVVVRVKAASLNYRDLMVATGKYNPKTYMPKTLGSDAAGEVAAVGAGVTRFGVGDRVSSLFFQRWTDGPTPQDAMRFALGESVEGVFAEYVVLPETGVIRTPEYMTDEEAATLPCAAVTAWQALVCVGKVKAGESVLVLGTGGVSLFALQIAKLKGARVVVTSSSDAKLERAKAMGADEGVNHKTFPAWEKEVVRINGGTGVDHVVEVGGPGTIGKSFKAVKAGGQVYLIGILDMGDGGGADLMPVLMRSIQLRGITVGSEAMAREMGEAFAAGKVKPVVDKVFEFSQAVEALRAMEAGSHFGKIVLRMG